MFALVDCNNFYASCERVFKPDLNGKPVVVLSNNDGCVIARSNEAKALKIPMGAPAFKFRELFENNHVHVFSSNYALYGDMSSRVMNILATFAPDIEIYSIDEAFLRFDGLKYVDQRDYAHQIRKRVFQWTGIPISIGIAPTKALAKVANKIAKKFPSQTDGVHIIDTEEKRVKALKWQKVEDVWGIGRRYSERLNYFGVKTAYDFTKLSDSFVRREMTVVGLRLKHDLEGRKTLELETVRDKKAIAVTRSFDVTLTDFNSLKERVATFAVSCAEKLRKQKSHCNLVMVFLQSNPFRPDLPQYGKSIVIKTTSPTNSSIDLIHLAAQALKKIYIPGFQYKRAGVMVMGLTTSDARQLNLFEKVDPRHEQLMKTIDFLNNSIGQQKVKFAVQSLDRTWKMKQESLSPRYTTRFDELMTVR